MADGRTLKDSSSHSFGQKGEVGAEWTIQQIIHKREKEESKIEQLG